MDAKRAAVHSGKYFLLTSAFAVVGLAFLAAGVAVGGVEAWDLLSADAGATGQALSAAAPGIVLAVVGVAVYRFGKAWALYKTLTAANEDALSETFDTQRVKSDIVSVLDDRLADMQNDLQSVNRELRKLKDDDAFDFGDAPDSKN
jgi:hypothetical protein